MSGHSKWSTIKRQKGAADQKRGALFSKLTKAIQIAVKEGGDDPEANLKLKLAVSKAKQANLPKINITRTICNIAKDSASLKNVVYEAFGPKGTALVINVSTDNLNRSVAEIKGVLNKHNGKLTEKNSARSLFNEINNIIVPLTSKNKITKEELMLKFMDLGAEDIQEDGNALTALFSRGLFSSTVKALNAEKIKHSTILALKPNQPLILDDQTSNKVKKLICSLEELSCVERVYSNVRT